MADADFQLVDRFSEGDAAAFDALVERHKQRVFNLVYRMTGDREWAEEITIDVFLETYLSLPSFNKRAKFGTWLHRLAVNVCLEHIRRKKAKRQLEEVPLKEEEVAAPVSPAEIAMTNQLAEQVVRAMQTLPDVHRAAITMFYLEERSCAEIAEILGIPRNTVKTRLFYGTRTLRDQLRAKGILPQPGGGKQ